MSNAILWSSPDSAVTLLGSELNSLASDARAIASSAFNNESARRPYGEMELSLTFASAPTAGGYVALYLVPSLDGTNFADGSGSVAPAASLLAGVFPVRPTTSAQRLHLRGVPLPPLKFKAMLENKTDQAFASSGNTLGMRAYSDEVQ